MMKILVTGGAGYLGSHTCVTLLKIGYEVVILDNLCTSLFESIHRIEALAGRPVSFVEGDIRDGRILRKIFSNHRISAVIHFAGLKGVAESSEKPLSYFSNNLAGSIHLCQVAEEMNVRTLLFSSSATVYGEPSRVPIPEDHPTGGTGSPYGRSKYMVEHVLHDLAATNSEWRIGILRYFNPVGAHNSGQIGEELRSAPSNLLPTICRVASGSLSHLQIHGGDYPTPDGTGIRDYIHVMDLAEGHVAALERFTVGGWGGLHIWNLGTGVGYSVLEIVRAFEAVSGRSIPYKIGPRRQGDVAKIYADTSKALAELGWVAKRNLETMMHDAWHWQLQEKTSPPSA